MTKLTIGTRGSRLALVQTQIVTDALLEQIPDLEIEQRIIKTKGDRILDVALSKIGDKGLFVKEIEKALLDKEIDIAVHSMKDMPTEETAGLMFAATPTREIAMDVLVSKGDKTLSELKSGAEIATSSLRRRAQLLSFRNDFTISDIRGNVETRLKKFYDGSLDGLILAAAGLQRLKLEEHISQLVPTDILMPAPAQGALAIQVRCDDEQTIEWARTIHDENTFKTISAERAFLKQLGGGCQTPIAAYCSLIDEELVLEGRILSLDGGKCYAGKRRIKGDPRATGAKLAEELLDLGAKQILEEIRA